MIFGHSYCFDCFNKRNARRRVFCWLPTRVYSGAYFRDGFRWLTYVWRDADGKHHTEQFT
jgi:hypothetical protein